MKIMVVNDVELNCKLISWMLESAKHSIVAADSGLEALELVAENTPDLVFMNTKMPDMDGFQTSRLIRQIPSCKYIPIIFLLTTLDQATLSEYPTPGADDILNIPINDHQLLEKIRKYSA
ncbi:MAG: hypothetical protein COA99_17260 [Moraxellaceae bacterium]|nr:MAG: hypothetical protein COA99_17260 [Moraxellaceae bacterium]